MAFGRTHDVVIHMLSGEAKWQWPCVAPEVLEGQGC